MRVLALDFGEVRCGVAVCDPTGTVTTPLEAVERADTRRGIGRIAKIAREQQAGAVVVGLPLTLAGEDGHQAARTREFAARLGEAIDVPVELHDERLTTSQARRTPGSAGLDSRAAAHLLESYLARVAS